MTRKNFSAKTLDDAITKACVEMGITSDKLDYIVTEQGSNGVFGIGARPWVISAGNKEEAEAEEAAAAAEAAASEEAPAPAPMAPKAEEEKAVEAPKAEAAVTTVAATTSNFTEVPAHISTAAPAGDAASFAIDATDCEEKASAFLKSVFESMGMEVAIKCSYDEMLGELSVDLSGDDMGVLIGKRGQTLDSLQYLTGQVINKHSSDYVRVKLDTENYRERRKEALETLAHNMAHKVRRTKHAMALEPMNPYERRIIHSTLQDEKDIITRSEGEEPYRHVVVCFVKHKKN